MCRYFIELWRWTKPENRRTWVSTEKITRRDARDSDFRFFWKFKILAMSSMHSKTSVDCSDDLPVWNTETHHQRRIAIESTVCGWPFGESVPKLKTICTHQHRHAICFWTTSPSTSAANGSAMLCQRWIESVFNDAQEWKSAWGWSAWNPHPASFACLHIYI